MRLVCCVAVFCGFAACIAEICAMDYFVSPQGNDAWSGRLAKPAGGDGPFRTFAKAAEVAGPGDTCHIREGVYRETLRPARSGMPGRPVVFRSYEGEVAVISGADLLGPWSHAEGKVLKASMPWTLADRNQVFAGGEMLTEARWPNNTGTLLQPVRATVKSADGAAITDAGLPGGDDFWKGALLWCAGGARWICWAAKVTAYDAASKTLKFEEPTTGFNNWYKPVPGNEYVLMGLRAALDSPGEWWYDNDARELHLWPPGDEASPGEPAIEAKRRTHAIDLCGLSHVHVIGLRFYAGGIAMDDRSANILLKNLSGRFIGHSYLQDISASDCVCLAGDSNTLEGCELAFASGSIVSLKGTGHRVINCLIHSGNYAARWNGAVSLSGRRHLVAHNTIRDSGRDLVTIHGLSESIIEHNDLSHAGWLTHDLGMIYGHNTDFQNTEIRFNRVHDNKAKGCCMGIYFDHCSHNVIVHNNAVWNVTDDPIRLNNPSYFNLVYNNTCWNSGGIVTFDHSHRDDMFGTRFCNNIFNAEINLPQHVLLGSNIIGRNPGFSAPEKLDFRLGRQSIAASAGTPLPGVTPDTHKPDCGAYQSGIAEWTAGHNFANPPLLADGQPAKQIPWANLLRNACFEFGLERWTRTGDGTAEIAKGNGWGNSFGQGAAEPTGTSRGELQLGGLNGAVEQPVKLLPNTKYALSGWLKVSAPEEAAAIGIILADGSEFAAATSSTKWTRLVVEFETREQTEGRVFIRKTSDGDGFAWADNLGLPGTPARR